MSSSSTIERDVIGGVPADPAAPLLEVENVSVEFRTPDGVVNAVNGISYSLEAGETLAILGESGSGKSVSAQAIMGIVDSPPGYITEGAVRFKGVDLLRTARTGTAQGAGRPHRDDLPGRPDGAQPDLHGGVADRRDVPAAPRRLPQGGPCQGDRADGAGEDPLGRRAGQLLPARVLRRHAPARHDRDGPGPGPRRPHRRRTHHRTGRDRAGPDHGAARGPAARDGHGPDPDHPRPRRRRRGRRPGQRHVRGPDRRDRARSTTSTRTRRTPTRSG